MLRFLWCDDIAWHRFDLDDAFIVDSAGNCTTTLIAQWNLFSGICLSSEFWFEISFDIKDH